jgi:hypothetical protein
MTKKIEKLEKMLADAKRVESENAIIRADVEDELTNMIDSILISPEKCKILKTELRVLFSAYNKLYVKKENRRNLADIISETRDANNIIDGFNDPETIAKEVSEVEKND